MKKVDIDKINNSTYEEAYRFDKLLFENKNKKNPTSIRYMLKLERVLDYVNKYFTFPRYKILDVGCAQGYMSLILAEKGYDVIAIDLDINFLKYAKLKYEYGKIDFVASNAENLPFKAKFDIIILGELLEHVAYPERILEECRRLLNEKGILIITTPNGRFILKNFFINENNKLSYKYLPTFSKIKNRKSLIVKQYGHGVKEHLFLFTCRELRHILKNFNILNFDYIQSLFISPNAFFPIYSKFLPLNILKKLDLYISKIPVIGGVISSTLIFVVQKEERI